MSAVARDYVYFAKIRNDSKEIPAMSRERVEQAKKEIANIIVSKPEIK